MVLPNPLTHTADDVVPRDVVFPPQGRRGTYAGHVNSARSREVDGGLRLSRAARCILGCDKTPVARPYAIAIGIFMHVRDSYRLNI